MPHHLDAKYQALFLVVVILGSVYAMRFLQFAVGAGKGVTSTQSLASVITSAEIVPLDSAGTGAIANNHGKITDSVTSPPATPLANIFVGDSVGGNPSLQSSSDATMCPSVSARFYRVQDLSSGQVLLARNPQQRWPIASITKLVTAIVATHVLNPDAIITITPDIEAQVGDDHTLVVGQQYSVRDLITIMLVISSNDAAYALADAYGLDGFVAHMNDVAHTAGMDQTTFYEPSGLSYLNQSTLQEISSLLVYMYRAYPSLLSMTRQKQYAALDYATGKQHIFSNIDFYAGQSAFIGGKTGYIDTSGGNLVGLFHYRVGTIIAGVFGSSDRFADMDALLACADKVVIHQP